MRLDEHLDGPELTIAIAGKDYHFSELPLGHKAKLQAWIRAHVPDPMEACKAVLEGLDKDERLHLLNEARKERANWPPDIDTAAGQTALLSAAPGQREALYVGLTVHQPDMTRHHATRLYRLLLGEAKKTGRETTIQKILAVMFALTPPSDEEGFPKDEAPPVSNGASTGISSFDLVSSSSE